MEREEAVAKLNQLIAAKKELHELAKELGVKVYADTGKLNKGWVGHTLEAYLGLPRNSSRNPNLGSWELKTVPLMTSKDPAVFKETMAITMINDCHVSRTPF
ncbi:MAG: MvaI/BcnI family restriction endonuclease, partial [Methylobacteriaceae bacterium]|nr:MvaI/BcnI family restriction endonuclease [Methylobacteriaceae bacterium]